MDIAKVVKRFLVPGPLKTIYFLLKYKSKVSPKSEIDLSSNLKLGPNCVISSFTKVKASDGLLEFGPRCSVEFGSFISAGEAGITIGENCMIGPNVSIIGNSYNYSQKGVNIEDQGKTSKGVKIGKNVWIGAGSVILDGSEIGDDTIIVANSLINRKYKGSQILQGSPAKSILKR